MIYKNSNSTIRVYDSSLKLVSKRKSTQSVCSYSVVWETRILSVNCKDEKLKICRICSLYKSNTLFNR